jgi:hypothetical protein
VTVRGLSWAPVIVVAAFSWAQNPVHERSFPARLSDVQAALKKLSGTTSGRLPVLEGFVVPGTSSLDHYQQAYYQCTVHVSSTPSGGSLVRVTAKITAWNNGPTHSGYEALQSNGRIESDLLDRFEQVLESEVGETTRAKTSALNTANPSVPSTAKAEPPPEISAPVSQLPTVRSVMAGGHGMPAADPVGRAVPAADPALEREAKGLEDILRNQSHPTNLVAVKQERAAILQSPRTDATVLFLADAEDEFEVLDMNSNWVYVRISGLSRGWIRRSSVEPLDDSGPIGGYQTAGRAAPADPGLFIVSSETIGSFPGQWEPLQGKNVEIISVQTPGTGRATSAEDRLQFAESEFRQAIPPSPSPVAGVVLIFDSEDGGMVAATNAALESWKDGKLSPDAFWKQCYLDPPEIFGAGSH